MFAHWITFFGWLVNLRPALALGVILVCTCGANADEAASNSTAGVSNTGSYDPLRVVPSGQPIPQPQDFTVEDAGRNREIPIRIYLPIANTPAPVVVFSHGLGGNRGGAAYLGQHWSARGYVCVYVQHPGSDDSVWKNAPLLQRMNRMRTAASAENFRLRVADIPAVLSQLETWGKQDGHPLQGRMDLTKIGMSGHSFGAITTQAVSGQTVPLIGQRFNDKRITAAVCFSPSAPRAGDPLQAFGDVTIPWLLMTGTNDVASVGDATLESRMAVYPALPESIPKYELVLFEAEHSAFSDSRLPMDRGKRNENHHRVILALSTAFWDAYLRDDGDAKQWLTSEEAKRTMEPKDHWQFSSAAINQAAKQE